MRKMATPSPMKIRIEGRWDQSQETKKLGQPPRKLKKVEKGKLREAKPLRANNPERNLLPATHF